MKFVRLSDKVQMAIEALLKIALLGSHWVLGLVLISFGIRGTCKTFRAARTL